jgi:predicted transcriptional regulator
MSDEENTTNIDDKVYAALQKAGGTLEHLVKATGLRKLAVDESLRRLLNTGRAERKWVLVSRGAHDWKFYAAQPHGAQEFGAGGAGGGSTGEW